MKKVLKIIAYACGGIMGTAVGFWGAEWCSWLTAAMICLAMSCCLFVCLHEIYEMENEERRAAEAARRSAYREAFFRTLERDRL